MPLSASACWTNQNRCNLISERVSRPSAVGKRICSPLLERNFQETTVWGASNAIGDGREWNGPFHFPASRLR